MRKSKFSEEQIAFAFEAGGVGDTSGGELPGAEDQVAKHL